MTPGRKLPEAIRRAIIRMAQAGSSYRTIAATLRVSTFSVWRVLRAANGKA
jgi:hypothetical protein